MPSLPIALIEEIKTASTTEKAKLLFILQANKGIQQLNQLINAYNQETDISLKKDLLAQMYQEQKRLDNQFSTIQIQENGEYRDKIHNKFYCVLQEQCKELGISSIRNLYAIKETTTIPTNTVSLPELIANMAPEKVNQLMKSLIAGNTLFRQSSIDDLYQPQEFGYEEFKSFLQVHSIKFLGGTNSKNYLVTNPRTLDKSVLKIDNRMGNPKGIEATLREIMQEGFINVTAERQATNYLHSETTHGVVVTEYCNGSDLLNFAKKNRSNETRIENALEIYTQMTGLLIQITANGYAFPDMKNANWLLDSNSNKLKIADTKSLLFTDEQGQLHLADNLTQGYDLVITNFNSAPEILSGNPVDADKMHANMLGKNLYQFLSQCPNQKLNNHGENFDFSAAIFQSPKGKALKELIVKLTDTEPGNRPSLAEAESRLNYLASANEEELNNLMNAKEECFALLGKGANAIDNNYQAIINDHKTHLFFANTSEEVQQTKQAIETHLTDGKKACLALVKNIASFKYPDNEEERNAFIEKEQKHISALANLERISKKFEKLQLEDIKNNCKNLLKKIAECKFGDNDKLMNNFINETLEQLNTASDTKEIKKIYQELETVEKNQQAPVVQELRQNISNLREKSRAYTIGYLDKANRTEAEMTKVPVTERHRIMENVNNPKAESSPIEQLASQRTGVNKGKIPKTPEGKVDENAKSAKLFKLFKVKFENLKTEEESDLSNNHQPKI